MLFIVTFYPETLSYSFRKLDSLWFFLVLNSLRFILWPRILLSWWRCPKLVKRICILLYWWSSLKKSRWSVVMCTPSPCPLLCPRHTPGQRTGVHSRTHSSFCSFFSSNSFCFGHFDALLPDIWTKRALRSLITSFIIMKCLSVCARSPLFLKSTLLDIDIGPLAAFSLPLFTNHLSLH